MDQDKEKNPIAEIFDEMFTLLEGLETRSAAMLDYLQEQQGVTDEKLAPYLDRAAAASDVRWRAARARMEHLMAPKPKSPTEAANDSKGKDEKPKSAAQTQPQAKGKDTESGASKTQGQKEQSNPESKDLGKELASAQPSAEKSAATETKTEQNQQRDAQKGKDGEAKPKNAEAQASALGAETESNSQKPDTAKNPTSQSDDEKPKSESSAEEKQQSQKAAK
jgi:hypothetical protein